MELDILIRGIPAYWYIVFALLLALLAAGIVWGVGDHDA